MSAFYCKNDVVLKLLCKDVWLNRRKWEVYKNEKPDSKNVK
ncbi:MAG: hypothetical protein RHS_5414 [Robinsoniella sp. RHS]|nr:MAG: hypothetical protein RHS_5414 [Robinsoniella sp. RHS]